MMKMRIWRMMTALWAMLLCLSCLPVSVFAVEGSKQTVRIGCFLLDGYQNISADGTRSGVGYDYLQELAEYADWEYEYIDANWNECLEMLRAGGIDLPDALQYSPERAAAYDYADQESGHSAGVLLTGGDSTVAYEDFEAFDGMAVGMMEGSAVNISFDAYAQEHGFQVERRYYPDAEKLILALKHGEVDAALLTTIYRVNRARVVARFAPEPFYFATTKGNEAILQQLNEALDQLNLTNPNFEQTLLNQYFGPQMNSKPVFSKEELEYIREKKTVAGSYPMERRPIEYYDGESDSCRGIAAMSYDCQWAQQKKLDLSQAYLEIPVVRISSLGSEEEKPVIVMPKGLYITEQVRSAFADQKIVLLDSIEDCLEALLKGEANTFYANLYTATYYLNAPKYSQLCMSDAANLGLKLAVGVDQAADPRLLVIINKAISCISKDQINEIVMANASNSTRSFTDIFYAYPLQSVLLIFAVLTAVILLLVYVIIMRGKHAKKMEYMLHHDLMTGMYNRDGFERKARTVIDKRQTNWVIVDFDINHFETFNCLFGYERGDQLLRRAAEVLTELCGPEELCGRINADHFVCLWRDGEDGEISARIERLDQRLCSLHRDTAIFLNYGVYRVNHRSLLVSAMIDRALTAKRMIKGKHDHPIAWYDQAMHQKMVKDSKLMGHIPAALENEEFVVYYQPQYDIRTEGIVGAEALVRWFRPNGEVLLPGEFIGLFEQSGLITRLDFYVLERVCEKLCTFRRQKIAPVPVSVNFSRAHLYNAEFPDTLAGFVQSFGIPPQWIQVEITESFGSQDVAGLIGVVNRLHQAGFPVVIDDFGSGLSSLGMIKDIPADIIKMDRSFISDNCQLDKGRYILESIFYAIGRMNVLSIAEGVETEVQMDFLRQCGCDIVQGYYFSKPLPDSEFEQLLRNRRMAGEKPDIGKHDMMRNGSYGLLEAQKLLCAMAQFFPLIVSVNLTKNSYMLLEYERFNLYRMHQTGTFDELIRNNAAYTHPEDWPEFYRRLSRKGQLEAYARGERDVWMECRQKGPDGDYHWVLAYVTFVEDPCSDDVLEITLCRPLDHQPKL